MNRLQQLRQQLEEKRVDAFLITARENRLYLSGFTGSAGALLITTTRAMLLTDFRYVEQAQMQAPAYEVRRYDNFLDTLGNILKELRCTRVAFESDAVTCHQFNQWQEKLPEIQWAAVPGLVTQLRMVKDENEINRIKEAAAIADRAWEKLLPQVRPGVKERDLALELEFLLKRDGSEGLAFDIIMASGPNGALPHATPGERHLTAGDLVVMDFGARLGGYCSDMTRTLVVGQAGKKAREVYNIVREAQQAALAAVKPGKTGKEVDAVARDIITAAGFGEQFGHGLGHGVGLAVHEEPRLSPRGEDELQPGMVVTVEPGVYLPGFGGVRIEDLVVVTENGCQILSTSTKDLLELG